MSGTGRRERTEEEWREHHRKKKYERIGKQRRARRTPEAQKALQRSAAEKLARRGTTTQSARGSRSHAGARETDVWHPEDHEPSTARTVNDDERQGKMFCRGCKAEVEVRQVDGEWITYNLDGTSHADSCPNPPPKREDW